MSSRVLCDLHGLQLGALACPHAVRGRTADLRAFSLEVADGPEPIALRVVACARCAESAGIADGQYISADAAELMPLAWVAPVCAVCLGHTSVRSQVT
jgi:hypothetical protein